MLRLYMRQLLMTMHKKIEVKDENDNIVYEASTDYFTLHDKTHIKNAQGQEVAEIEKKLISLNAKFTAQMSDGRTFLLHDELGHLLTDNMDIPELGWRVKGDLMQHDYELVNSQGDILAATHRKWISIREAYEVEIEDESQLDTIITVLIILEHIVFTRVQNETAFDEARYNTQHRN